MAKTKDIGTENQILEAASRIFKQKGMAGARMQEIADEARINKSLLHYYFRNKEQLFAAVFRKALAEFAPRMNEIFSAELPLFEKIRTFTRVYIGLLQENPHLPAFIIQELNRNADFAQELLAFEHRPNPMALAMQIQEEVKAGNIRAISPPQLIMNLISLCVFPFSASGMVKGVFGIPDPLFDALMEERKVEVAEFIIHSIKK